MDEKQLNIALRHQVQKLLDDRRKLREELMALEPVEHTYATSDMWWRIRQVLEHRPPLLLNGEWV